MKTLYVFMLVVAVLLSVDALPYVPSKVIIPLKNKQITRRRAHKLGRRVTKNLEVLQQKPDRAYFGELTFGKTGEGQTFDIQFDTGSADLWVINIGCISPACNNKPQYDQGSDTDYIDLVDSFSAKYVEGDEAEAKGWQGTTIIQIGDLSVRQKFGLVDELTDNFKDDEFQGIIGMAFDEASENDQITLMSNLFNDVNNGFDAKQFSFKLGRLVDDTDGELTIGGTNPKSYTGAITWTGLSSNNDGLWIIPLDDCLVNGIELNLEGRVANLDTGTTLISVPHDDALQVYANIQHEEKDGHFYISCNSFDEISLRINGATWIIDSSDFIIEDGDKCYGAIVGDSTVPNEWLLGAAFLKNVYSVFDLGNKQVGLAQLA